MDGKYNREWFKKRALESFEKVSERNWDYSDSLLLYSPEGQQAYESAQVGNSPYFELVTKKEHEYLKSVVEEIACILPIEFEYIDLGPGTENKESYFFEEFKKQGKKFIYTPVDISEYFLDISKSHAEAQCVVVRPVQSSFEELSEMLGKPTVPRFVSMLGLTFSNYSSEKILKLLKEIAGTGSYILFDVQLSERINLSELVAVYQEYVAPACDEKIKLLDLDPDSDVTERVADKRIEISCLLNKVTPALKEEGAEIGDRLILFQSYRPTKEEFEEQLKGFDYTFLDNNHSFVSALVRT